MEKAMLKRLPAIFALTLMASIFSIGAKGPPDSGSGRYWYRYYDNKRQPTISDTITSEHISHGYDVLNVQMQVIQHVNPQRILTPEEKAAAKAKHDAAINRAKEDKQLLRLYSSPDDAERTRDRQIDAIQLRIDFDNNFLNDLRQHRAAEAQRAASVERSGKPVSDELKKTIANYDQQIQVTQAEITQRKAEQDKVRSEFNPIIQRLRDLTSQPESGNVPASGSTPASTGGAPDKS
jgi:hypothetical protein